MAILKNPHLRCLIYRIKKFLEVLAPFAFVISVVHAEPDQDPSFKQTKDSSSKTPIRALYIPLADHYAALVAYERYAAEMKYADFQLEQMKSWDFLRAKFLEGKAEMAFVMSPLAMDMYRQKPHFRWVGLMHRDGNALAMNDYLSAFISLAAKRVDRLADDTVAEAFRQGKQRTGKPIEVGVPHLLSTHSVVLYSYLKSQNLSLSLQPNEPGDVLAISVAPPLAPIFLKASNNRAQPAAFEQSLPWADVVETKGFGKVGWYSKDVIQWPEGHVECIALASDPIIASSPKAVHEVMTAIHKAGRDIERARKIGGQPLQDIVDIVQRHIPSHNAEAIKASLNSELRVINYQNLNIDKAGLQQILEIALEGNILMESIDVNAFADTRFNVHLKP